MDFCISTLPLVWFSAERQRSGLKLQRRERFKPKQSWNKLLRESEHLSARLRAPVLWHRKNLKRPRTDRPLLACQSDQPLRRLPRRHTRPILHELLPSNPHGLPLARQQRKNKHWVLLFKKLSSNTLYKELVFALAFQCSTCFPEKQRCKLYLFLYGEYVGSF